MSTTTTNVPVAPVLDRIAKKGELVLGTAASMPPLNMTTKDGEVIGFEIDIARYMAGEMGVKLRIEAIPFAELLPALESGKVDIVMSGMTITGKRNRNVAFVGPYFTTGKGFLTKIETIANAKDPSDINSPETKLVALKNSTSQDFVEAGIPKAELVLTANYAEAVDMVLNDEVHAMVADYPICFVTVARNPGKGLLSIFTELSYEPIGAAVPAGDPLLVNWLDNFFDTLQQTGRLEALRVAWFTSGLWLDKLP
jgi:polar amino acid transport system substrate-binding protein